MSDKINRQWRLAKRPEGMVSEVNFEFSEEPVGEIAEGEYLIRNHYLAFEPAMRGWMEDRPSYIPPVQIGEVMRGATTGEIIESKNPDFAVGAFVQGLFGWQEYAIGGRGISQGSLIPEGTPPTWPLGVLGITGLTAYFGLLDLGKPQPGETVLVSGAAGATGSIASQIAKQKGCRVVGIAGGAEKCAWLSGEMGLDAAIDYKSEDVSACIRELCPDGLNVYFDNVGGWILNEALGRLNMGARIALCGAISVYNADKKPPGPANYLNLITVRGTMQGFNGMDHWGKHPEISAQLAKWMEEGKIRNDETILDGLDEAWRSVNMLFAGENIGKLLVRVADPSS